MKLNGKSKMKNICILLMLGALICPTDSGAWANTGSYAVVASEATYKDADWKGVVEVLKDKHNARLITYKTSLDEVLKALKEAFPTYICFVVRAEEAGRDFVRDAHILTRKLDSDPYTDAIWGVITGYDAGDALRIVSQKEPLIARRLLTGTVGSPLDQYDEGMMFNELKAKVMWQKSKGGSIEQKSCPTNATRMIVDAFNDYHPDVFITSGHATERNWMIGYSYRSGFLKCKDGRLYGQDLQGKRYDINSPNPKVHLAVGNCLIANITDRQCMALALMRSAGVCQMVGYTIPTSYGYGGWGVKDYFSELQAGRFTLTEAHYVNNLALVYELEKRGLNTPEAARPGLRGDRDVVVLYGDPAWEASMTRRRLFWTQTLEVKGQTYIFTITANETADWDNRPVIELLPHRVKNVRLVEGDKYKPVITDNFILVQMRDELLPMKGNRGGAIPIRGDFQKGQVFKIVFRAERI
jgi:zinc protease